MSPATGPTEPAEICRDALAGVEVAGPSITRRIRP
ncbi:hypothetical protein SAMN05421869_10582 [Nonomuraea jiangxiensis]|uniref:Uncharacterized protein n=1 Tax=Nonomuraea jiangxiensis TaxID=633440 RepID=A0A1G8JGK3_9ACTN|nr:hypothetical protein SAMN05421869_10582 [Nonomuraea jiangxiensis]